jgi:hypothetical protein
VDPASACLVIGWIFLHVGSLATAWGSRVAAGSWLELPVQFACFLAMAAVGSTAWICRHYENGLSVLSGVVLVATVLTAVVDFRRTHEIHPVLHSATHS